MEERQLTRAELQAQIDALNAENAQLKAIPTTSDLSELVKAEVAKALAAQPPSAKWQQEMVEAMRALSGARSVPSGYTPAGPMPELKPYRGFVQATEDCTYGSYRLGPNDNNAHQGDVFEVDLPALWSDDPFLPVIIKGYTEVGAKPITVPNPDAPPRIDFRFRPRVSVSTDIAPLRAGQY